MMRRGNHEGSFSFVPQLNVFRYRESYIDSSGNHKVKQLYSKELKTLRSKVREWRRERDSGLDLDTSLTVGAWIEKWLALVKPTIRLRTYDDYCRVLNSKVVPVIGKKRLMYLSVMDCQELFNSYIGQLSPVTINDIRRRLKVVIGAAVEQGLIRKNVASLTRPIHEPKKEVIALSEEEVESLLQALDEGLYVFPDKDKPYKENISQVYNKSIARVLVHLALDTGCRIGELLGLTWSCIGLKGRSKGQIKIIHSLSSTSEGVKLEDVKTKSSCRVVKVPDSTVQLLQEWKNEQDRYKDVLQNLYDTTYDFVFTNAFGRPVSLTNFYRRYWKKLIHYVGLPDKYTFHCLRRTHATLLLKHGVNIKVVSERLGHSSTSVTANVYAGLLPDMQNQAVDAWNAIFSSRK